MMKISLWLEHSIVLNWILMFWAYYKKTEDRINSLYLHSFCHKLFAASDEWIKMSLKYSVFGRITEINEDGSKDILGHTVVVKKLMQLYKRWQERLSLYFKGSGLAGITGNLSEDFENHPLKVGGWVAIIALAVNSILIVLSEKDVNMFGIALRMALFLIALASIFSGADWRSVKGSSFTLKKLSQ